LTSWGSVTGFAAYALQQHGCASRLTLERMATLLVAVIAVLGIAVLTFAAVVLILRAAVPALSALRDQGD
jgi:hypothetical protein